MSIEGNSGGEPGDEQMSLLTRLRKVLGRIRRSCAVDTYDVFARAVTDEHLEFECPDGYRFAWGTEEDIAGCSTFHTELDEEERRLGIERIKFDHRVVIGFAEDTPVFSMWMNPRNLNVPCEIKRQLSPNQAFIYKAYTSPDHRGKGLYKVGMRFVLNYMAQAGQTELIGYAHLKKSVSRKGLATLEFTTKGRYNSFHIGSWQTTRVSTELARNFPAAVPRSNAL